jgi:hypothetical protein
MELAAKFRWLLSKENVT